MLEVENDTTEMLLNKIKVPSSNMYLSNLILEQYQRILKLIMYKLIIFNLEGEAKMLEEVLALSWWELSKMVLVIIEIWLRTKELYLMMS